MGGVQGAAAQIVQNELVKQDARPDRRHNVAHRRAGISKNGKNHEEKNVVKAVFEYSIEGKSTSIKGKLYLLVRKVSRDLLGKFASVIYICK